MFDKNRMATHCESSAILSNKFGHVLKPEVIIQYFSFFLVFCGKITGSPSVAESSFKRILSLAGKNRFHSNNIFS